MTVLGRAVVAVAALLVAAGAALTGVAATAAPVPETGVNGLLSLDADPYPAQDFVIARGERVLWPVTATLDAPTTGDLTLRITSGQPLAESAEGLRLALASCDEPWALTGGSPPTATCDGGPGVVEIAEAALAATDATDVVPLGRIAPGVPRHFLVTLSLPLSTPGALAAEPAEVSLGFAAGDAESPGRLAETGGGILGPVLLGIGLLLGGGAVGRARRTREPS